MIVGWYCGYWNFRESCLPPLQLVAHSINPRKLRRFRGLATTSANEAQHPMFFLTLTKHSISAFFFFSFLVGFANMFTLPTNEQCFLHEGREEFPPQHWLCDVQTIKCVNNISSMSACRTSLRHAVRFVLLSTNCIRQMFQSLHECMCTASLPLKAQS